MYPDLALGYICSFPNQSHTPTIQRRISINFLHFFLPFFFRKFHLKRKRKNWNWFAWDLKGKRKGGQLWRALCGCDNNREAHLCVCELNGRETLFSVFILLPCFTTWRHTPVQLANHKKQLGDSLKKNNGTNMGTVF